MRNLILGIDSGTQSTKVLAVDARDGKVLGTGSQAYDLIPNLSPGAKEQHPHTWRDATAAAIRQALRQAKAVAADVQAIGVSGQQHGFVPLDMNGEVIRPAKLWCDTSTAAECDEIMEKLGGLKKTIKALGNAVLPGFTASKILWLKKNEPKNFARLATVLLPHDYLNFWLTGEKVSAVARLAPAKRPAQAGQASVEVYFDERPLGRVVVGPEFAPYVFEIAPELTAPLAGRTEPPRVKLVSSTWNPRKTVGVPDPRDLGVRVMKIEVR